MPIHAAAGMDACMLECGARNAGGTLMQNGKGLTDKVRHLAVLGKGKGESGDRRAGHGKAGQIYRGNDGPDPRHVL